MKQEKPFDFFRKLLITDLLKIEALDEFLEFHIFELFKTFDDTRSEVGLLLNDIWLHSDRLLELLLFQSVFLHQRLSLSIRLF